MAVGDKIKWLRKLSHMPQQDVADKLNVDRATLTKYENEKKNPKDSTIESIANVLDVNPDSIITEKMDTPSRAMHILFGFSRRFGLTYKEIEGNYYLSFPKLQPFINVWIKKREEIARDANSYDENKISKLEIKDVPSGGTSFKSMAQELWESKFPKSAIKDSLISASQWDELCEIITERNNYLKRVHTYSIKDIEENYASENNE